MTTAARREGWIGALVGEKPTIAQKSRGYIRVQIGNAAYATKLCRVIVNSHRDGRRADTRSHVHGYRQNNGIPNGASGRIERTNGGGDVGLCSKARETEDQQHTNA